MNNTKIEWADMTWNPLTGCLHGCSYCYARRIAERFRSKDPEAFACSQNPNEKGVFVLEKPYVYNGKFEPYPFGFCPTFHMQRLHDLESAREPKNVFVCSMSDLFGAWVPDWIIEQVLEACRRSPQHRYLFLTKNPARYDDLVDDGFITPGDTNFWLGSTVTDLSRPQHWSYMNHTFMSCEPLMAPWPPARPTGDPYKFPEWVILGAETGNRKGKVIPKREWVENIVSKCRMMRAKVFMKDSLIPIMGESGMIREFPRGLE